MEVPLPRRRQAGHTIDFLLTARRDVVAARRFFERAIRLHDVPQKITIDKSGENTAALRGLMVDSGLTIELRQSKYLNRVAEQDHRAIKRRTRPMMGFQVFQISTPTACRNRDHAHDQERADALPRWVRPCPLQISSTRWLPD